MKANHHSPGAALSSRRIAALRWLLPLLYCFAVLFPGRLHAATLPPDFIEQPVTGPWADAVGIVFDENARMYVWERSGRVWFRDHGSNSWSQLIDLSQEVGAWGDHGLLGFALDPNFLVNGNIYLMYVVDRHHLMHFGTGGYNPNANDYNSATIGRITRYTCNAGGGFRTVNLASRTVLVGETRQTGIPITFDSHGVGTLLFGTDGTLLASCGDGASWVTTDTGSLDGTYFAQALANGILRTNENVGAFRSQMVNSHSGKMLRLDPANGNGVSSNPFFDSLAPRSPRSRIWALGLRNPYRMAIKPGSGSHDRAAANPGVLIVGDVGWGTWDEINVVTGPGKNFGWPLYEGMDDVFSYSSPNEPNRDVPNPFFGVNGCTQQYYFFNQLLAQDTTNAVSFTDSCGNSITGAVPRFVHARAVIDWEHFVVNSRTSIYDSNGNAAVIGIGDPGSPVDGSQFAGSCSIGGVWYTGSSFPAQYSNTYFHADYVSGWIQNFVFGTNNRPTQVNGFLTGGGGIVALAMHPLDGGLYYLPFEGTIMKISYAPGGDLPPSAIATPHTKYGPGPLTVQFTGSNSFDPEGLPLIHTWDFGDGSPASNQANPAHTFTASPGVPTTYTVTLTVTDDAGQTNTTSLIISVNNTPPSVIITSPVNGSKYPVTSNSVYTLAATVSDAESSDPQLAYQWVTYLHHNTHQHSSPADTNHSTTTLITAAGCVDDVYYYRIALTVTDPHGLSAYKEAFLFPNCTNQTAPVITWPPPSPITYGTPLGPTQLNATGNVAGVFTYHPPAGTVFSAGPGQPLSAIFIPSSITKSITMVSNTLNVLPAPLTIVADDKIKNFGAPVPTLTASYSGFVNGDTPATLDTPVTLETTAASGSPPGFYPITANGATDVNYSITHSNGTLTVLSPSPPVIVLMPANFNITTQVGVDPGIRTLVISNAGSDALFWTATVGGSGPAWLQVTPSTGANFGTADLIVNLTGLAPGTYSRTVNVAAPGASNGTQIATVNLTVNGTGPAHYDFTYPDRAGLLAAGWDFLARTAGGDNRDTEDGNAGGVSYDQSAHPGVLRIPVDAGDVWTTLNNTRNNLFRDLPSNWTSIRLKVAAFNPAQNSQQVGLAAYQDDDNYLYLMRGYESGQKIICVSEVDAAATSLKLITQTATANLHFRIDRNPANHACSAFYSLNGATWISAGSITQALTNPRLGIIVGASPNGFPNADIAWAEITVTPPPPVPSLAASPTNLNFVTTTGINPSNRFVAISNPGSGTLNWSSTIAGTGPDWLSASPGSGTNNGTLTVSVNAAALAAGAYTRSVVLSAPGASNSPRTINVSLTVQTQPAFSPLVIVVSGSGTVSPNLNGQNLEIGKSYTVTAKPGTGYVFSNWTGDTTASTPVLTFIMQSNRVLEANFIPNPFIPIAGVYQGLFYDTNGVAHQSSGFFTASVSGAGSFSAKLMIAGKPSSLSGKFAGTGTASNLIVRAGLPPVTVQLQLDFKGGGLSGQLSGGAWTAQLYANRAVNPALQAGKYTLLLPGGDEAGNKPGGDGFGTVIVSPVGGVSFKGTLGDGTKVAQKGLLMENGQWPFYTSLYSGNGSMLGWLTFSNAPDSDITGLVDWFKLPLPGPLYPLGFTNEVEAAGSIFQFTAGIPLLDFTAGHVWLADGNLGQSFTNDITVGADSKVSNQSSNRLTVTIATSTGLFKGSAVDPATGKTHPINGVVLQKQNFGSGYFPGTNQTGRVHLGP